MKKCEIHQFENAIEHEPEQESTLAEIYGGSTEWLVWGGFLLWGRDLLNAKGNGDSAVPSVFSALVGR